MSYYILNYLLTNLLTYLNTYSMEQSPSWEPNRFLSSQEIPRILWNQKVHYRIHKRPPPVRILSLLDPVHTPTSYFLKIHLNIILPSKPESPKWPLSLRFPHQNPVYAYPTYALHAPPISFFSVLSPEHYCVSRTDPYYIRRITTLLSSWLARKGYCLPEWTHAVFQTHYDFGKLIFTWKFTFSTIFFKKNYYLTNPRPSNYFKTK